jgi:hypothetical protein
MPTAVTSNTDRASRPADERQVLFFVDATYDVDPDDGEWWLDLGRVDLPPARPCNSFTTAPQP